MALVAYGNSDSSDFEEDDNNDNESAACVIINKKTEDLAESKPTLKDTENPTQGQSLFTMLPQPTNKAPEVLEEDDEFLHKKATGANAVKSKAKITVPSLSDFQDVENSTSPAKPKKTNGKKSGLLSMLPQPKNSVTMSTRSLIPHVLTQKPKPNQAVKKKEPLPSPMKKNKVDSLAIDYSDDSDNEEVQNDFFSMNKPAELPVNDTPLDIDENVGLKNEQIKHVAAPSTQKEPVNIQSYFKADTVDDEMQSDYPGDTMDYSQEEGPSYSDPGAEASSGDGVLNEEAIMKLCGSRGKRKREEIQILDINQGEVLAEARALLLKGLMEDTSKRISSSKKKGNEPTTQQRRKHQITYLAHQAKANEVELQNQWAQNRMSRRQTQSKYGF